MPEKRGRSMTDKKYYTVEETAAKLGVSTDELANMTERGDLRRFPSGTSWQFRVQDVDKLAAHHHGGAAGSSDQTLTVSDSDAGDVLSSSHSPKGDSDSDVRLTIGSDLDLPILGDAASSSTGSKARMKRKSGLAPSERADSGMPVAPLPGDSSDQLPVLNMSGTESTSPMPVLPVAEPPLALADDIKLKGDESSQRTPMRIKDDDQKTPYRLNQKPTMIAPGGPDAPELAIEDDIKLEGKTGSSAAGLTKKTKPAPGKPAAVSPFELGIGDLSSPAAGGSSSKKKKVETPAFEISGEDEVDLGSLPSGLGGHSGASGINLQSPSDSGISLEKVDPISHFELDIEQPAPGSSKTLRHHIGGKKPQESSSDFELSLDEGDLSHTDAEAPLALGGEKDIFETDFDMPALDDESGFDPVVIDETDTDVESSDFDLSVSDEDVDMSGSQVVALGDEEVDDAARTMIRRKSKVRHEEADEVEAEDLSDESFDDLGTAELEEEDEDEEEEALLSGRRPAVAMEPASWGILPVAVMLPTVILTILGGLMSFELLHTMWGWHQPAAVSAPIVTALSNTFGNDTGPKR